VVRQFKQPNELGGFTYVVRAGGRRVPLPFTSIEVAMYRRLIARKIRITRRSLRTVRAGGAE
jgi:hypothetical protein